MGANCYTWTVEQVKHVTNLNVVWFSAFCQGYLYAAQFRGGICWWHPWICKCLWFRVVCSPLFSSLLILYSSSFFWASVSTLELVWIAIAMPLPFTMRFFILIWLSIWMLCPVIRPFNFRSLVYPYYSAEPGQVLCVMLT